MNTFVSQYLKVIVKEIKIFKFTKLNLIIATMQGITVIFLEDNMLENEVGLLTLFVLGYLK